MQYTNMTNLHLCQALVERMRIDKVSRTTAYNLLMASKASGLKRATLSVTPIVDVTAEEDSVKLLSIRNSEEGNNSPQRTK